MTAAERFVLTPAHPGRPRGKWFIWDHGTQTRYEAWGQDEAAGVVAAVLAAEVAAFLDLETGRVVPRNRRPGP